MDKEDEAVGKGAGCRGGGGGREASSLRVSFADKRWLNVRWKLEITNL